jgi:hypothetical protein
LRGDVCESCDAREHAAVRHARRDALLGGGPLGKLASRGLVRRLRELRRAERRRKTAPA